MYLAEFAQKNLNNEIDKYLIENKNKTYSTEDDYIKDSIKMAYDSIENQFLKICEAAYSSGFYYTGNFP